MAGSSIPAPLGSGGNQPGIDSGTLVLAPMPAPGATTGAPPPSAISPEATPVVAEATPVQVEDPAIEALDLASTARDAAYALKKAHATVAFTSGRRSKADQARAMAGNVVLNRQWIEQTYAAGTLRTKCQKWVDENPTKTTLDEVAEGLLSVLDAATDAELGSFSRHLSGLAFDVQPVTEDADAIKKSIRALAGLDKFLEMEGGLVRWHAQF